MSKFGRKLFRLRGYTPVPFLILGVIGAELHVLNMITGFIILAFGEYLRILGVSYAGKATRSRKIRSPWLVTNGPFAHTRNPIYLGNILIYCGFTIFSGAYFPYLLITVIIYFTFQYYFIVKAEEETLLELFAEPYQKYLESVPRFLPRFSPYRDNQKTVEKVLKKAFKSERSTFRAIAALFILLALKVIFFN